MGEPAFVFPAPCAEPVIPQRPQALSLADDCCGVGEALPRAEEMRAEDSIVAISHKSVIGCSECSQVEDNGAFSRFWSYVRWRFPNKEEAGHPAKRTEHRRRCGLVVLGRDVGAGRPAGAS